MSTEKQTIQNSVLMLSGKVSGLLETAVEYLPDPKEGTRKTREWIENAYENLANNVQDVITTVDETVSGNVSRVTSEVKTFAERVAGEVQSFVTDVENKIDETLTKGTVRLSSVKNLAFATVQDGVKQLTERKSR